MTGDATLQVTIFAIGLVVVAMAMVGGLLVMKQWYQQDLDLGAEGKANETELARSEKSNRLAPVPE